MSLTDLRKSPTMSYLLDALNQGKDIGPYGRETFVRVARFYLTPEELVQQLEQEANVPTDEVKTLVNHTLKYGDNPPSRRQILEWQGKQAFPICPNPDDPNACDFSKELNIPERLDENLGHFRETQFESGNA